MPILAKIPLGSRVLIFRLRETFGPERLLIPRFCGGPFLCFVLKWRRLEIEFGLKRWI